MPNLSLKNSTSSETISAIFIIAFVSLFILANFMIGFVWPLYILAMAIGFILSLKFPKSGVFAIVFLTMIFERFFSLQTFVINKIEYKLYPLDILMLGIILSIILQIIFSKQKIKFKKTDWALVVFILLNFIYYFLSIFIFKSDQSLAFSTLKNYAFYGLFYFIIAFLIRGKEDLRKLFQFFLAGATAIIVFIAIGIIRGEGLWTEFTPLSTSGTRILAFPHAFFLAMAILGVLTYLIFQRGIYKKTFFVLMLVWAVGVTGSMMRHLWISLGIAIASLYFIIPKSERKKFRGILGKYATLFLVGLVLFFYLSIMLPNSEINKIGSSVSDVISQRVGSLSNVSEDESFAWRSAVWKEAIVEFGQNSILGIGSGQKLYVEIGAYRDLVEVRNIHNSPLIILVQLGLLTFASFVFLIIITAKNLLKKTDKNWIDFLLLALLANYTIAFFFQPYLEANHMAIWFWIILGLMRVSADKNFLKNDEKFQ
jgi:O-antigen ligase